MSNDWSRGRRWPTSRVPTSGSCSRMSSFPCRNSWNSAPGPSRSVLTPCGRAKFLPKAWTEFVNDPDPRDIMERARQEVPLEEVVSMFTVSQDPNEHVQTLQGLLDGGITTVYVHSAKQDQSAVMDFYGQRVLPRVRRERPAAQTSGR